MQLGDILLIVLFVVVAAVAGLYFFNRKNMKKVIEAQDLMNANKVTASIYIIDKKYTRPTESNLSKSIYEKLPKRSRIRKIPLVKAKVGPQIVTLMCDKGVYEVLTPKKTVKVQLSGIYIMSVVGLNLADKKKKTWREKLSLWMSKNRG